MDETTATLLAAARGDDAAMRIFIQDTHDELWRFCAHLVDPESADDLTQEVYLRAHRSVRRFRGEASARTWLFTIARRTASDEIRRRQRRRRLPGPRERIEPDHAPSTELLELLRGLDEDRRLAFVLTQIAELSYEDAAEAAGVPVGTIRSRVARARADLVAQLRPATSGPTT